MATWVKTDGTEENFQFKDPFNPLRELQEKVGGTFEVVRFQGSKRMIINEDGLAKELPFNYAASRLYGGRIVGDVVLCHVFDPGTEQESWQ